MAGEPFQAAGSAEPATATFPPPELMLERGRYRLRFARTPDDVDAALQLRYRVFNLEMGEGLAASHRTGRDEDPFDVACHHLLVEDRSEGQVIGTYRMQTREMAWAGRGFYSAGEFDLGALAADVLDRAVEVGRACIEKPYRTRQVLFLLWKGLAAYLTHFDKRYLFGCCSLSEQDPAEGIRVLHHLTGRGQLHPDIRVTPRAGLACRPERGVPAAEGEVFIPLLFATYLRYGAMICGAPAIDREFGTIDFLVILDTEQLAPELRRLFF
jgi:putative hemolysin